MGETRHVVLLNSFSWSASPVQAALQAYHQLAVESALAFQGASQRTSGIENTPHFCLNGKVPKSGITKEQLLELLPGYARHQTPNFPKWKVNFIRQNREWFTTYRNYFPRELKSFGALPPHSASSNGIAKVRNAICGSMDFSFVHQGYE